MIVISPGRDPEKAIKQEKEFFELIGRAISQWSSFEITIWHIYARLTLPGDVIPASAAFHAIMNANTRLDMISAALRANHTDKVHSPAWEKLRKKIRVQSTRRAKLAHWTVHQIYTGPDDADVTIYLHPPILDYGSYGKNGQEKIHAKTINEWNHSFTEIGKAAGAFYAKLVNP